MKKEIVKTDIVTYVCGICKKEGDRSAIRRCEMLHKCEHKKYRFDFFSHYPQGVSIEKICMRCGKDLGIAKIRKNDGGLSEKVFKLVKDEKKKR